MTVRGKIPDARREKSSGDRSFSVVSANTGDASTVTMDGQVIGNAAWADADAQDVYASVTGVNGADVTVQVLNVSDASAAGASDITVYALTE